MQHVKASCALEFGRADSGVHDWPRGRPSGERTLAPPSSHGRLRFTPLGHRKRNAASHVHWMGGYTEGQVPRNGAGACLGQRDRSSAANAKLVRKPATALDLISSACPGSGQCTTVAGGRWVPAGCRWRRWLQAMTLAGHPVSPLARAVALASVTRPAARFGGASVLLHCSRKRRQLATELQQRNMHDRRPYSVAEYGRA